MCRLTLGVDNVTGEEGIGHKMKVERMQNLKQCGKRPVIAPLFFIPSLCTVSGPRDRQVGTRQNAIHRRTTTRKLSKSLSFCFQLLSVPLTFLSMLCWSAISMNLATKDVLDEDRFRNNEMCSE